MTAGISPHRVLITGAAGRIGRAAITQFASHGTEVTALDLHDPGDLGAARVFVGDASDSLLVERALEGFGPDDAVVHLAAIPSPTLDTAMRVYSSNATAAFAVLDTAGRLGVRRAAMASSMAIYGMAFADVLTPLPYLPVDEQMPVQIADPYALAKLAAENAAQYCHRRYGMTVVSLRLPYVGADERLAFIHDRPASHPRAAAEVWAYLHTEDAARAFRLATLVTEPGAHVVLLAAPETTSDEATESLLARHFPDVARRAVFSGRSVPVDTSRARELLGFVPERLYQRQCQPASDERSRIRA